MFYGLPAPCPGRLCDSGLRSPDIIGLSVFKYHNVRMAPERGPGTAPGENSQTRSRDDAQAVVRVRALSFTPHDYA